MADWKCPNCGHVLGYVDVNVPGAANAAAAVTFALIDPPYGRCSTCGDRLPPPNAAAHQCWGLNKEAK